MEEFFQKYMPPIMLALVVLIMLSGLSGCMPPPQTIHPTDAYVHTVTETDPSGHVTTKRDERVESHETPGYGYQGGYPTYGYIQPPLYPSPIWNLQQQNTWGQGWGGGANFGGSMFFNFR